MRRLESRLADWHQLYKELQEAQRRLSITATAPAGAPDASLAAEVRRLQHESDAALASIHELLRADKAAPSGPAP